jgi:hypothetical protein
MPRLKTVPSGHGDIGNTAAFGRGFEVGRTIEQTKAGSIEDFG